MTNSEINEHVKRSMMVEGSELWRKIFQNEQLSEEEVQKIKYALELMRKISADYPSDDSVKLSN